jgi:hypothetical protein
MNLLQNSFGRPVSNGAKIRQLVIATNKQAVRRRTHHVIDDSLDPQDWPKIAPV